VTGQEVGMQVRQHHVPDRQPVLGGKRHVLLDVALRVHDDGLLRHLVGHQVGRVREALEIELLSSIGPYSPVVRSRMASVS
jgi:hypothetical protein